MPVTSPAPTAYQREKGVFVKGVVGTPGKTVSKRVKVSSSQLAVWGGDGPVTAIHTLASSETLETAGKMPTLPVNVASTPSQPDPVSITPALESNRKNPFEP